MSKHLVRGPRWMEQLCKRGDPTVTPKVWHTYRERQVYWKDQEQKRAALNALAAAQRLEDETSQAARTLCR